MFKKKVTVVILVNGIQLFIHNLLYQVRPYFRSVLGYSLLKICVQSGLTLGQLQVNCGFTRSFRLGPLYALTCKTCPPLILPSYRQKAPPFVYSKYTYSVYFEVSTYDLCVHFGPSMSLLWVYTGSALANQ